LTRLCSSTEDQIAALRAAAQKARDDAARLSEVRLKTYRILLMLDDSWKPLCCSPMVLLRDGCQFCKLYVQELGKGSANSATQAASTKPKTRGEIEAMLSTVNFADAPSQVETLEQIGGLWKSANLRTFPVSLNMMETRSSGVLTSESMGFDSSSTNVNLDDFKYATLGVTFGSAALAVASLAFLPENVGATFCYIFALVPVLFLGLGSTVPGVIADAIARIRNGDSTANDGDNGMDRICRHEAAHFLCGYLCGLPVCEYSATAQSVPRVIFHPTRQGPATRAYTPEEIAALAVVSLSGSVAEVLKYGNCKGAINDLLELQNFFRRSSEFIGAQKEQDLTRWGAITSYQLLTAHKAKLEALVEAFREQQSVAQCIAIIESTE
jgi:hypothetical protein